MRSRLFISTVLIAIYGVFRSAYTPYARSLVQTQLAPFQVGNNNLQYGLSRTMTIADFVDAFVALLILSCLTFIWLAYYLSQSEPKMTPSKLDHLLMGVLVLSGLTFSSGTAVDAAHTETDENNVATPLTGAASMQVEAD